MSESPEREYWRSPLEELAEQEEANTVQEENQQAADPTVGTPGQDAGEPHDQLPSSTTYPDPAAMMDSQFDTVMQDTYQLIDYADQQLAVPPDPYAVPLVTPYETTDPIDPMDGTYTPEEADETREEYSDPYNSVTDPATDPFLNDPPDYDPY